MKGLEIATRISAAVVGGGIIGCVAFDAVMASGRFGTTQAPMFVALAAGLFVGRSPLAWLGINGAWFSPP